VKGPGKKKRGGNRKAVPLVLKEKEPEDDGVSLADKIGFKFV